MSRQVHPIEQSAKELEIEIPILVEEVDLAAGAVKVLKRHHGPSALRALNVHVQQLAEHIAHVCDLRDAMLANGQEEV
jgi:hypothetical protein